MRYLIGISLLLFVCASHAELAVVTGMNSTVNKLSKHQVADIFLARTTHFPDGSRAQPFELTDPSLRTSFYRTISGKTLPQVTSYWTTLIFTGRGKPPKSIDKLSTLLTILKKNPNAISYIPLEKTDDSLKILYVLHQKTSHIGDSQ